MGWFRKRSVEAITAPITRIVTELHDHAEHHDGKAEVHDGYADMHRGLSLAAKAEKEKALVAASKIAGLVS